MPSATVEDYLKAIYRLGQGSTAVGVSDLAKELKLTPGTVTTMIQRLHSLNGLVEYRKRHGAALTASGHREAMRVLRRHRIVELFLVEVVGLGWEEVHEEAERLEHALSDRLVERLSELLGHPKYDPHGTPIPNAGGALPEEVRIPLSEAVPGSYEVVGFGEISRTLQDLCRTKGLMPGRPLRVISLDRESDLVRFTTDNWKCPSETVLGTLAAGRIFVRPKP